MKYQNTGNYLSALLPGMTKTNTSNLLVVGYATAVFPKLWVMTHKWLANTVQMDCRLYK
jgi:hypothetical protein